MRSIEASAIAAASYHPVALEDRRERGEATVADLVPTSEPKILRRPPNLADHRRDG
jgi:hypothetical protein